MSKQIKYHEVISPRKRNVSNWRGGAVENRELEGNAILYIIVMAGIFLIYRVYKNIFE